MNRIIKSDLPPSPSKKKIKKKWIKKSSQWDSNLKKCSLLFSNPPRYHLSYLDLIDQLCIYPVMKGKSHNFVNKTWRHFYSWLAELYMLFFWDISLAVFIWSSNCRLGWRWSEAKYLTHEYSMIKQSFLIFIGITLFHNAVHHIKLYRGLIVTPASGMASVNSESSHTVSHHARNEPLNHGHRCSISFLM